MRITIVMGFFLPVPPAAGGATEKSWHRLAIELARRGHAVTLISRRWKDWPDEETRDGVHHLRLPGFDHTSELWRNLWRDFRWSRRVRRRLPPADVTVINAVSLPIWAGRASSAGAIVTMCGRMPKGQYRRYGRLDRVLAVSSPVRDAILRENSQLESVIRVTGYPIDWQALSATRTAAAGRPVTLGYVGRLHEEKGLMLLAEALRILAGQPGLPAWRMALCGPHEIPEGGSGTEFLKKLHASLGKLPSGSWEILPPRYDDAALQALYRTFDVFCYPSLATQGETFGVAVAEAMAARAVPVVSRLACFTDFVRDRENGCVFDHTGADAAQSLASRLAQLLIEPAERQRLANTASESVARFDFAAYAEELERDFSTLKSPGAPQ